MMMINDHDDLSSSSSLSFANTFIGLKKILVNLKDTQGSRTLLASAMALQTEQTRRQRKVKQPTNKVWCVSHLRQCCHNNTLLLLHSHSQSSYNQADAGKMPNSARSRISLCQQIAQRVKGDAKQSVKDIWSHICQIELNELYFVFKGWSIQSALRLSSREFYIYNETWNLN